MPSFDCLESENFQVLTQNCNSIWNVTEETPKSLYVLSEHSNLFIFIFVLSYWQCLWHVGFLVPQPSVKPSSPHLKHRILTTELQGSPTKHYFF